MEARHGGGVRTILADRRVGVVVLLAFVLMLGAGITFPILPLYVRSFGGGYDSAGIFIAVYSLARLLADLGGGVVVDRVGERLAAAGGLLVVAVMTALTGLAPSYGLATAAYACSGIGSAVVFAAMYSQLLKTVPQERMARTLSVFYGAFNLGIVAGGLLSGVIADRLGLASPLFFTAGIAALGAFIYLRLVPAPERAAGPRPERTESAAATVRRVLRTPGFAMVLATNFAYLWMIVAVFDTLLPLYADSLGMSTIGIGVVFAISLAVEFAVLYPAGSLADRRGRRAVLIPALAGLGLATVAVGWAGTPLWLGIAMALLGIASGFAGVPPGAMLADVMPRDASGTAVGVFRFAGDLGFTIGPLVAGYGAARLGFEAAFALTAIPTVLALAVVLRGEETLGSSSSAAEEPA
jgi:DHA1 family multidrug resistance protein-like MFS transporter